MSMGIGSPQIDIDAVVNCIKSSVMRAKSEEDLRVSVSVRCIEEGILKPLGISEYGKYEYTLISGARVDALYGHVIVEYKAPGKLSSQGEINRAKEQVIGYIMKEAGDKAAWGRYLGVIISDRIAFVRYDKVRDRWVLGGPYEITRESVIKLVEAIRGLRRKALNAENLISDFGPSSSLAKRAVKIFYSKLLNATSPRTKMLFEDWMRLFRQATGYDSSKLKNLKELAREYGIDGNAVDFDKLLFAVQTYYALILKLLAAEVVYLYGGKFYKSYISYLDEAYTKGSVTGLKEALKELESGAVFKNFGIQNFLEGDYFSWYLNELDRELADVIAELIRRLSDFEPATPQLEPESARDLLKRLYQGLVPDDLRHNLGEYYTPDWLADFILDEVGLGLEKLEEMGKEDPIKPLTIKVLDPACGSGTFLVRYIARLREYASQHFLEDVLVDYLVNNVVGYDLNPLAVLAARTNFLLMIADLRMRGNLEIPVYLTDSLMIEKRHTIEGSTYVLKTVAGDFRIPTSIVDKGLLSSVLEEMAQDLKSRYRPDDFVERLKSMFGSLSNGDVKALKELYAQLYKLEEEGKDDVWISIIRNAFAPIIKGKFDVVVGNPPWINWESLPEEYRNVTKDLWSNYGLTKIRGKMGLGKVKKDLAMLFFVRSFDLYLKKGGKLGFLVPLTLFKTQAGAGFRDFLAKYTKVLAIHDMVTLYPFQEAINRTAAVIVEKSCELKEKERNNCTESRKDNMEFKHFIWINELGKKPIPTDMPLEEVKKITNRYEAVMIPLEENDPSSPWMQITPKLVNEVRKVQRGVQMYKAHSGVVAGFDQIYYIKVVNKLPDKKLLITNSPQPRQRKKVEQVEVKVEPDLVYPLVRGRNVKRWFVGEGDSYIIVPHDSKGKPIYEKEMRINYPETYSYLYKFKSELESRSIYKKLGKGAPFYTLFGIGEYTFAPYKVVWKHISGSITGKADFNCAVIGYKDDKFLGRKLVIPNHKLMLVPLQSEEEAYYLAGVLNSSIVRAVVASYTIETEIATNVVETIKVPKYNPNYELHRRIVELSRRAHEIAKEIYQDGRKDLEEELKKVEDEIDRSVAKLLGISEDMLNEFRKLLKILLVEETEEPVEEEEVEQEPSVEFLKTEVNADQKDYIELRVTTGELCESAEITFDAPWGSQTLQLQEGTHKVEVGPLMEGSYEVKYSFKCGDYRTSGTFKIESKSSRKPPRRPTTLKLK